ncbi:major facilitator superfamily domain-containing protein [Aspergillus undulatus]|uniref:major facilitator superfamily domain-containing protein n=1 Tax=Aspergillus undulatus TaxID=1810928 RepID=UPI003CCCF88E
MGLLASTPSPHPSYTPLNDDEDCHHHQHADNNVDPERGVVSTIALLSPYLMMWLIHLVEGLLSAAGGILAPYVSSAFALHSLTPTVGIMSSAVGGVTNLTLAKILDAVGRPHGFLFCILLATLGLVMMTACNSIQAYASAQVLQTVGNNGILYTLTVLVAESSSLRNRGLIQALVSSPNLFTFFLAGPVTAAFLNGPGWRWLFGLFTVLVPCVTAPLFALMLNNHRKAQKSGFVSSNLDDDDDEDDDGEPRPSATRPILDYIRQFDAVGLILLSAGVALFLLPFNLYASQGWSSIPVSGMLVMGIALLTSFAIWEKQYAHTMFLPYSLLFDRTALGACILSAVLFTSFWSWNSFFSSYLQVVHDLSVKSASYIVQLYTVCSVFGSIAVGALIHYTGRFKPVCLYAGIPVSFFGSALMLYHCHRQSSISGSASGSSHALLPIIAAQILISLAAGAIMVADEVAMLAAIAIATPSQCLSASAPQHGTGIAISFAVLGVFGNVGTAVGLTIASALWQRIFPTSLAVYLRDGSNGGGSHGVDVDLDAIYGNISMQLSFPVGSAIRTAIARAYGDALCWMLAVGTGLWVVGFLAAFWCEDVDITSLKTEEGE